MQDANFYSLRDPPHPRQIDCVLDNKAKSPPCLSQPFSTLKLGTLNVRGLRSKVEDVIYTLVAEQMDILCLTETLLSSEVVDQEVQVDGYCLVRQDRTGCGGGVAVYFRESLPIHRVQFPVDSQDSVQRSKIETVFVELQGQSINVLLGCVYRPPSAPVSSWACLSDTVEVAIATQTQQGADFQLVLTGDFNVNTLDRQHSHLRHYEYFLASFNLSNHVSKPTRYSKATKSCLDHLLTDDPSLINSCSPVPSTVDTDHELVCADLLIGLQDTETESDKAQRPCVHVRNFSGMDIEAFCTDLEKKELQNFSNELDVDLMWDEWSQKFHDVLDKHAPVRSVPRKRSRTHRFCPWSTPQLRRLQHVRLTTHRQLKKNPGDCVLRHQFSVARKAATKLSKTLRNTYFKQQCCTYSRNPKKFWKLINDLTGRSKNHPIPQAPLQDLSDQFTSVVTDLERPSQLSAGKIDHADFVNGRFLESFSTVSATEVYSLLKDLDSSKAPGSDGIPASILKNCASVIAPSVATLFNTTIKTGHLPKQFKKATIAPVFKSGDKHVAANYRPISLLPILSKVLEKVIASQLKSYLKEHNLLPAEQFAYRDRHSTEDALVYTVNKLLHARDVGKTTGLVFVDLSKAFDRVQHQTLINELADIGLKDKALQWFISYLSDRSQQVRLAGSLSEETTCSRGVPQGSVLGPLLFTLYIRALPEIARVPCLMFADDILLFSSSADPLTSSQELTHAVTNVYNWLDDRGLQMNVKKTQAMFVPASQVLSQEDLTLSVFCCDRQLSSVHSYKYLGVVLDSKLTWALHMEHLIRKVSSKIGVLYRSRKKLSTDAKRQYYLSVIQSDLAYGSNAFYSSLPQSAKEHLSRLSKRGVRAIFGAPPWTHTEPLLREMKLCSIDVRFKLKLLIHTYRCTHALASSLLCQQYKLRSHSNSTHSTTRSQLTLSLCIPSAARRPGTISPLFTSTLLWNSLPSPIRSASSLHTFRQELQKYLGIPVIRPR